MVAIAALASCDGAPSARTHVAAILDGAPSDEDPFAVGLVTSDHIYCSATLVAPRVVLTAAHCLRQHPPERVFFGAARELGGVDLEIRHTREEASYDGVSFDGDLAAVVLDSDAPDAPIALPGAPLDHAQLVDLPVRIIGFGATSQGGFGRKHAGLTRIESVAPRSFGLARDPARTCTGDSGGPAVADLGGREVLVGITSNGDAACMEVANDTRIDAYLGFIERILAATRPASVPVGGLCLSDDACEAGTCITPEDAPRTPYCTRPCDGASGCPEPMTCERARCRHPLPSPGAFGAACTDANECESGSCLAPDSGEHPAICTTRCLLAKETCPDGFTCLSSGDRAACFPEHGGCGCRTGSGPTAGLLALACAPLLVRSRRRARP